MDYLREHEPVAHVLRKHAHCSVGIQLGVGKYPENDG